MALAELVFIFGGAVIPITMIVGAIVIMWFTFKWALFYIIKAAKDGHAEAIREINRRMG